MTQQIPLSETAIADIGSATDEWLHIIGPDLAYKRLALVNVVYYGLPGADGEDWVLIDAGVAGSAESIRKAAIERFGNRRPAAILLTHAHFDHVGALQVLADSWDVPIYAHDLELPYLNGKASYPPPNVGAGGGIMPLLSPLFPRDPIDVSERLKLLPPDGSIPHMPGWRWIETPGHSPGHISFWREEDRALIVGDAFITTNQESAYAVATQAVEMHGPPKYFTPDWKSAAGSVEKLAALQPEMVITGHGRAMQGPEMRAALRQLSDTFWDTAVPNNG